MLHSRWLMFAVVNVCCVCHGYHLTFLVFACSVRCHLARAERNTCLNVMSAEVGACCLISLDVLLFSNCKWTHICGNSDDCLCDNLSKVIVYRVCTMYAAVPSVCHCGTQRREAECACWRAGGWWRYWGQVWRQSARGHAHHICTGLQGTYLHLLTVGMRCIYIDLS